MRTFYTTCNRKCHASTPGGSSAGCETVDNNTRDIRCCQHNMCLRASTIGSNRIGCEFEQNSAIIMLQATSASDILLSSGWHPKPIETFTKRKKIMPVKLQERFRFDGGCRPDMHATVSGDPLTGASGAIALA